MAAEIHNEKTMVGSGGRPAGPWLPDAWPRIKPTGDGCQALLPHRLPQRRPGTTLYNRFFAGAQSPTFAAQPHEFTLGRPTSKPHDSSKSLSSLSVSATSLLMPAPRVIRSVVLEVIRTGKQPQ